MQVAIESSPARIRNAAAGHVLNRNSSASGIEVDLCAPAVHVAEQALHGDLNASLQYPTELLKIAQVEVRTKMKRANIYRLIQLGQFPAPIHLGGAKWRADEVEEFIRRRTEERDRERGKNNFVPRLSLLSAGMSGAPNEAMSADKSDTTPSQPFSNVRMLDPQLCEALRLLKVDIPELYLDPTACNVVLAVIKVDLPLVQSEKNAAKVK